jgi:Rod binding domain-containing protein
MTMPISNSAASLPADYLSGLRNRQVPAVDPAQMAKTKDAAQDFEAFFVTHAFEDMFAGISSDPLFGGGEAENMFQSFLLQEYGKTVAKAGGIGVADMVQRQLLQLQESPK